MDADGGVALEVEVAHLSGEGGGGDIPADVDEAVETSLNRPRPDFVAIDLEVLVVKMSVAIEHGLRPLPALRRVYPDYASPENPRFPGDALRPLAGLPLPLPGCMLDS